MIQSLALLAVLTSSAGIPSQGREKAIMTMFASAQPATRSLSPSTQMVTWAGRRRLRKPISTMLRAALDYWLALATSPREPYIRDLVDVAQRSQPAPSRDLDVLGALPEGLCEVCLETNASSAYKYVVTLSLDGGPGETLSGVRSKLFRLRPTHLLCSTKEIAHGRAAKAFGSPRLRSFIQDLRTEYDFDQVFRGALDSLLRRLANRRDSVGVYLRDFCTELRKGGHRARIG